MWKRNSKKVNTRRDTKYKELKIIITIFLNNNHQYFSKSSIPFCSQTGIDLDLWLNLQCNDKILIIICNKKMNFKLQKFSYQWLSIFSAISRLSGTKTAPFFFLFLTASILYITWPQVVQLMVSFMSYIAI